ncbi:hypothetical protein, partial [Ralstonia solanacearum]|uniref:hypothetical protein n=1 Tax=Ralstonia solanacearum TaxID=305 RepID=UPI00165134E9
SLFQKKEGGGTKQINNKKKNKRSAEEENFSLLKGGIKREKFTIKNVTYLIRKKTNNKDNQQTRNIKK